MARARTLRIPIIHHPATAGFLILGVMAGCGRLGFEVLSLGDDSLVNVAGPDGGVGAEPASEPQPNPADAGAVVTQPAVGAGDSGANMPADTNASSSSSGSASDLGGSTTASTGQGGGEGGLGGASGNTGGSAGETLGIGGTGGTPGIGGTAGTPGIGGTGGTPGLAGAGGILGSGGTGGTANGGTTAAGAPGTGGGSTGGFAGAGAVVCVPDAECACDAYGGSEYRFCGIEETHAGGQAACEAAGMTLIRVDDQAENDWLLAEFTSRGLFLDVSQPMVMLGGTDAPVEGEWRWPDGELFWSEADGALLYENWWPFFPKAGVQNDCVGMLEDGTWAERACNSGSVTFVCESRSQ